MSAWGTGWLDIPTAYPQASLQVVLRCGTLSHHHLWCCCTATHCLNPPFKLPTTHPPTHPHPPPPPPGCPGAGRQGHLVPAGRGGAAAGQLQHRGVQLPEDQVLGAAVLPVPHHRPAGQAAQDAQDRGDAGGCDGALPQRAVPGGCAGAGAGAGGGGAAAPGLRGSRLPRAGGRRRAATRGGRCGEGGGAQCV